VVDQLDTVMQLLRAQFVIRSHGRNTLSTKENRIEFGGRVKNTPWVLITNFPQVSEAFISNAANNTSEATMSMLGLLRCFAP